MRVGEFLVVGVAVRVGVQDLAGGVLKRGADDQVRRTRVDGLAVVAAERVHLGEERAEVGERQGVGRDVVDRARAVLAGAVVEAGAVDPVRRIHERLGEERVPQLFARLAHGGDERAVNAPVVAFDVADRNCHGILPGTFYEADLVRGEVLDLARAEPFAHPGESVEERNFHGGVLRIALDVGEVAVDRLRAFHRLFELQIEAGAHRGQRFMIEFHIHFPFSDCFCVVELG